MAQIQEGCSYSLITKEVDNAKRQVYFVKLTDSCLKAIEEHTHDIKSGSKSKPIIRFDGQTGVVTIPLEKKFQFAISNVLTSDTNPLQECIKQSSWKSDELLSYGPLEQKISINATDDVYENTKNRMAQVDQERKDVRTKEIKLGNVKKGIKNKVIAPDSHKMTNIKKKLNAHHISHSPKPTVTSSTNHISPVVHSSKKSPIMSTKKSPTSSSNKNSPSLGAAKFFTCRQRVIHILALRDHRKPELISRLQREAITLKERTNLTMVLQQVAACNDSRFALLPKLYADLQVDTWPFYSESEKLIVKRNIASKKNDPTSPQLVSSTSKSPEEKIPSKRPLPANEVLSKKPKVECSDEPSSTSASPSKTLANNDQHKKSYTSSPVSSTEKKKCPGEESHQHKKSHTSSPVSSTEKKKCLGEESPPTVASTSDSPEYLLIYKPITSREQRFQYKRDFQSEYPEYIQLKKNLDAVSTKFIDLDRSWRRTSNGSAEYLRIQEEIMTAYNRQQQDEKYHDMKRRCEEMHQKLSHIKKLVMEYDNQMVNS